jgi:DNA-binding LacI/PurR family transcriptional regulator
MTRTGTTPSAVFSDVASARHPRDAVSSREEGRLVALALLSATPRPTALLAMSDELAIGALAAARELGLRVPRDVSVIGWDDSPARAPAIPPSARSASRCPTKGAHAPSS